MKIQPQKKKGLTKVMATMKDQLMRMRVKKRENGAILLRRPYVKTGVDNDVKDCGDGVCRWP